MFLGRGRLHGGEGDPPRPVTTKVERERQLGLGLPTEEISII